MKSKSGIPCVSEVRHFAIDYYLSDSTLLTHFQHHSVCGTVENFGQHHSHYVRSLWMAPAELCSWSPSQPYFVASLVHSLVQQTLNRASAVRWALRPTLRTRRLIGILEFGEKTGKGPGNDNALHCDRRDMATLRRDFELRDRWLSGAASPLSLSHFSFLLLCYQLSALGPQR